MKRTIAAWLLSVIAGAFLTMAFFTFGTKGLLALLAAALATVRLPKRERGAALVGLCLGVGGVGVWAWSTVLIACSSAGEGQAACYASWAPWYLAVSIGMAIIAGALTPVMLRSRTT